MMRRIVGWTRQSDMSWRDIMSRMNTKFQGAQWIHYCRFWSFRFTRGELAVYDSLDSRTYPTMDIMPLQMYLESWSISEFRSRFFRTQVHLRSQVDSRINDILRSSMIRVWTMSLLWHTGVTWYEEAWGRVRDIRLWEIVWWVFHCLSTHPT